jgi:hypothetical protein
MTQPAPSPLSSTSLPLLRLLAEGERHAINQERKVKAQRTHALMAKAQEPKPAQALVMVVMDYHCECGQTYRAPQPNFLVRYEANANSVHMRRESAPSALALPREIKVHTMSVPFCEACFMPQAK